MNPYSKHINKINRLYTLLITCLVLFVISLIFPISAYSQEDGVVFESEGTDFWLTFLPNYHNTTGPSSRDSIYIYITSKVPTLGTIYYNEFSANNIPTPREHSFVISQPNTIYTFSHSYLNVSLTSFNHGGGAGFISLDGSDDELILSKSFHIVTEDKSTVYALDYAETTAEAFIVLASPALGKEYFVMSYNSDGYQTSQSTPSQFAIVALHDSTTINITPSTPTARFGLKNQTIMLNVGETYLVQAEITNDNLHGDLTGSHILADKEIAVFSGHQRATTPINSTHSSRDCLIEQMIPLHSWGYNAITTPFERAKNYNPTNSFQDFFRVLAARDSTLLSVNEDIVDTLNKGEFYEADLKAALVSANHPIMVMSYTRTEGSASNRTCDGDPLMIVVPPIEQYKQDYNVINAQATTRDYFSITKFFTNQFLTIVIPDSARNDVYIDGKLLVANYIPIGNSGYSYYHYRSTDGGHNIFSNSPISVQVYGYGTAVSYGYLGGMSFRDMSNYKFNLTPDICFNNAQFVCNESYNSGIQSYQVFNTYNCTWEEISKTRWRLQLEFQKINPKDIAYFSFKEINIYGKDTTISDTIPASFFEIDESANYQLGWKTDDTNVIDFGKCTVGTLNTSGFVIYNGGTTEDILITQHNIKMSQNKRFSIGKSNIPTLLKPQDSMLIYVYYNPTLSNSKTAKKDYDTLLIDNGCNAYTLILEGEPIADTLQLIGRCDVPIRAIADSAGMQFDIPIVSPNPADGAEIQYKFTLETQNDVLINIYNYIGILMKTISTDVLNAGNYEIDVSTTEFNAGNYFIVLTTPTERKVTAFIKK